MVDLLGTSFSLRNLSPPLNHISVLKSTGSAFENFYRDEYTTLVPVDDRIFSTSVDLSYTFTPVSIAAPTDEKKLDFVIPLQKGEEGYAGSVWDDEVASRARAATLDVFAVDESASVQARWLSVTSEIFLNFLIQATLYKMAQRIIAENASVQDVSYALPNKHYIPVDMKYLGIDNTTPQKAEVFVPTAHPSGYITATVSRK